MLGIPRSTYYFFAYKKPSKAVVEREVLKQEIPYIYDDSNGIYDAPKIHKILSEKFNVSIKRVQRIVSELGLKSVIVKKFKHHTTKIKIEDKDNIASVMDLHTKKIVGYSFDKNITTDLIIRVLDNVVIVQKPNDSLIFYSDSGSQYTSSEFINYT